MTRRAERGEVGQHLARGHRSVFTARRAVWATSVVLALGVTMAAVAVQSPASPRRAGPTTLSNPRGSESTADAQPGVATSVNGQPSIAEMHPGMTIGSPAGQAATIKATRAVVAAQRSSVPHQIPTAFEPNLVRLYGSIYTAAHVIPGLSKFAKTETPAQFSAALGRLTARAASDLYEAVHTGAGLGELTNAVNSFIPVERATVRELRLRSSNHLTAPKLAQPGSHKSTTQATAPLSPEDLTTIPATMPQTGSFGGGATANYVASCPSYWSTSADPYADNAIYGLQIVIDVASAVYNAASTFDDAFPASAVADALTLVAQEVQNDGIYLKDDYAACEENNVQQAGLDIDNSTYQTYQLLASVAGTANEADSNLAALINQNAADYELQLQSVIEQALTQTTAGAPMASLELPSTAGGYLDSTPVGVQSVVTTEIANLEQAGQLTSPLAERDLGLGGQAYAAGEYKLAFDYYRLAYQAAAQ